MISHSNNYNEQYNIVKQIKEERRVDCELRLYILHCVLILFVLRVSDGLENKIFHVAVAGSH